MHGLLTKSLLDFRDLFLKFKRPKQSMYTIVQFYMLTKKQLKIVANIKR